VRTDFPCPWITWRGAWCLLGWGPVGWRWWGDWSRSVGSLVDTCGQGVCGGGQGGDDGVSGEMTEACDVTERWKIKKVVNIIFVILKH
jgi:hypothetical protein